MTKRVTFKKFLAILLSVFMAFAFLSVCAQSVYASEEYAGSMVDMGSDDIAEKLAAAEKKMADVIDHGSGAFDDADRAYFYNAFTSDPDDFPTIDLKDRRAEVHYGYFFEVSLKGADNEDFNYIVNSLLTPNKEYSSESDRYTVVPAFYGLIYEGLYNTRNNFSASYDNVKAVVDSVVAAAYDCTVTDLKNQGASDPFMSVEEFMEYTEEQRARMAESAVDYLVEHAPEVPFFKEALELDQNGGSGYGSIFSQGSSIAMLVVAIAEAAVIVALLAKNKKYKSQIAAK